MIKKYKITYRAVKNHRSVVIAGLSPEDAKRRFLNIYPKYEIITVEEM